MFLYKTFDSYSLCFINLSNLGKIKTPIIFLKNKYIFQYSLLGKVKSPIINPKNLARYRSSEDVCLILIEFVVQKYRSIRKKDI